MPSSPLVDTHAHIHLDEYSDDLAEVLDRANEAGVTAILSVGVNAADSAKAVELAEKHDHVFATVGLHPHEAKDGQGALNKIADLASHPKVVAIGECGLDFFKEYSPRQDQIEALKFQIEIALKLNKPLVFHVRDTFDEFFELIDQYKEIRGVVHSFTSTPENMQKAVERGLYVAFNGIMTFTKDENQVEAARTTPLDKIVLETDCPFLSPPPVRGKRNEPANVALVAKFLADLRGDDYDQLCRQTTTNATGLFDLA